MELLQNIAIFFSEWMRPHLKMISLAIVATLLTIYGGHINDLIKKALGNHHFLFRFFIFVLVCAFGYGMLTIAVSYLAAKLLTSLTNTQLSPVIIGIFFFIGLLAERKNHI